MTNKDRAFELWFLNYGGHAYSEAVMREAFNVAYRKGRMDERNHEAEDKERDDA